MAAREFRPIIETMGSNHAMERTAGRSALPLSMTSTFNPQPCAPSPAIDRSSDNRKQINEEAVFVTGSLILQRIKLKGSVRRRSHQPGSSIVVRSTERDA